MSTTLKTLVAKLRRRRRSKCGPRYAQNNACDDRSSKSNLPVTERMANLTISAAPSTAAPLVNENKNIVTFGCSPDFDFTFNIQSATQWPGPAYDQESLFAPGVFDKARSGRQKVRHQSSKRKLSQEGGQVVTVRAKEPATTKAARDPTKMKKNPRPIHYYGSPPSRDPPHHLLNLPAEIRNQIYRILCVSNEPVNAQFRRIIKPKRGHGDRAKLFESTKRFPREPALALVSRQLMQEVLSVFYSENTFVFRRADDERLEPLVLNMTKAPMFNKWQPKFGFANAIRRIQVRLTIRPVYSQRSALVYTFRKVPDESVQVKNNIEAITWGYCRCFDRHFLKALREEIETRAKSTNIFFEASRLASYRTDKLALDPTLSVAGSGYRARKDECETCGLKTVRLLETGM